MALSAKRAGHGTVRTLAAARRVGDGVRGGLGGPGVPRALRDLRRMLDAEGVGLAELCGSARWSGAEPPEAAELVDEVLRSGSARRRPALVAEPLHAHDEPAGVLLVAGAVRAGAVREAVRLVEHGLEHGRLESSAEKAAHAELRALRAEISPHFVYNALTVVASLVLSDPDRARELMLDFADYTRYGLARNGDFTTVSEEFRAIETYLALQKAVLGERLSVQVRVAPEVLAVPVPYLVLEPLVENAIRHGVEPGSGSATIQVRGEADGPDCVITVEDDGVGMDPEVAAEILAGSGPGGVGLANADQRLRTVYGSWYGLVVETRAGAGTRVVLRVPRSQPGVAA